MKLNITGTYDEIQTITFNEVIDVDLSIFEKKLVNYKDKCSLKKWNFDLNDVEDIIWDTFIDHYYDKVVSRNTHILEDTINISSTLVELSNHFKYLLNEQ